VESVVVPPPAFTCVLAADEQRGIGRGNDLPWPRLPGDVAHFKAITTGTREPGRRNAVVMGRRTYDNSVPEWGGKGPLGDVPCFVLTHGDVPGGVDPVFTFVTDGVESAHAQAQQAAGEKRIGVMGAQSCQQFIAAGLVDELRIHVVNVLLGDGRRLFDVLPRRIELEQTDLSETDGVVHIRYRVK